MSQTLPRPWTRDEFLTWERDQPERWEFDGFRPVAMVGATAAHHRIARNGETALRRRLTRCEVFRETMKLRLEHTHRYPDLMVVCSEVPGTATEVSDHGRNGVSPVVAVFEALSEGNAADDRITKNEEYRRTPSILYYVMLEQSRAGAMVFTREGTDWVGRVVAGPDASLALPEIGVEVPLAEFYEGVLDSP